jgi:hypothetical protein
MREKRVYQKKKEVSDEELQEIRIQNKQKLDKIMSDLNYMENLGKKFYGEKWYVVMPDGHYLKEEHKKAVIKGTKKITHYMDRPVIQIDLDGKVIDEWGSARIWADAHDDLVNKYSAAQHVTKCATGKGDTAYGYRWKFKEEEL